MQKNKKKENEGNTPSTEQGQLHIYKPEKNDGRDCPKWLTRPNSGRPRHQTVAGHVMGQASYMYFRAAMIVTLRQTSAQSGVRVKTSLSS